MPPFRRVVLVEVFALSPPLEARIDFNQFVRFLQSAATQAAKEERELQKKGVDASGSLPTPPPRRLAGPPTSEIVCFQPTLLSSQPRFSHPPPASGLWKKREITVQERTTEYTKIDDQGRPQRLVEKERHQTKVIHMESLTGEFAHREITQFEQTEHLNDEMVHFDSGREEFLHLKSQHDEISRFDTSTPSAGGGYPGGYRPEECEQPPPSPSIKRDPSSFGGNGFGSSGGEDAAEYQEADPAPEGERSGSNNEQEVAPQYDEAWSSGEPAACEYSTGGDQQEWAPQQ